MKFHIIAIFVIVNMLKDFIQNLYVGLWPVFIQKW
jgi:hypothetical protein